MFKWLRSPISAKLQLLTLYYRGVKFGLRPIVHGNYCLCYGRYIGNVNTAEFMVCLQRAKLCLCKSNYALSLLVGTPHHGRLRCYVYILHF